MGKGACTYIMTDPSKKIFYTGVTPDLHLKVSEHKNKIHAGSFTARNNCIHLVWFEAFYTLDEALLKANEIRKLNNQLMIELIELMNPGWDDLHREGDG